MTTSTYPLLATAPASLTDVKDLLLSEKQMLAYTNLNTAQELHQAVLDGKLPLPVRITSKHTAPNVNLDVSFYGWSTEQIKDCYAGRSKVGIAVTYNVRPFSIEAIKQWMDENPSRKGCINAHMNVTDLRNAMTNPDMKVLRKYINAGLAPKSIGRSNFKWAANTVLTHCMMLKQLSYLVIDKQEENMQPTTDVKPLDKSVPATWQEYLVTNDARFYRSGDFVIMPEPISDADFKLIQFDIVDNYDVRVIAPTFNVICEWHESYHDKLIGFDEVKTLLGDGMSMRTLLSSFEPVLISDNFELLWSRFQILGKRVDNDALTDFSVNVERYREIITALEKDTLEKYTSDEKLSQIIGGSYSNGLDKSKMQLFVLFGALPYPDVTHDKSYQWIHTNLIAFFEERILAQLLIEHLLKSFYLELLLDKLSQLRRGTIEIIEFMLGLLNIDHRMLYNGKDVKFLEIQEVDGITPHSIAYWICYHPWFKTDASKQWEFQSLNNVISLVLVDKDDSGDVSSQSDELPILDTDNLKAGTTVIMAKETDIAVITAILKSVCGDIGFAVISDDEMMLYAHLDNEHQNALHHALINNDQLRLKHWCLIGDMYLANDNSIHQVIPRKAVIEMVDNKQIQVEVAMHDVIGELLVDDSEYRVMKGDIIIVDDLAFLKPIGFNDAQFITATGGLGKALPSGWGSMLVTVDGNNLVCFYPCTKYTYIDMLKLMSALKKEHANAIDVPSADIQNNYENNNGRQFGMNTSPRCRSNGLAQTAIAPKPKTACTSTADKTLLHALAERIKGYVFDDAIVIGRFNPMWIDKCQQQGLLDRLNVYVAYRADQTALVVIVSGSYNQIITVDDLTKLASSVNGYGPTFNYAPFRAMCEYYENDKA